jgi:hypothetical protein
MRAPFTPAEIPMPLLLRFNFTPGRIDLDFLKFNPIRHPFLFVDFCESLEVALSLIQSKPAKKECKYLRETFSLHQKQALHLTP